MRKSLNLLAAASLLAALGACSRQPADDERQLNEARDMLNEQVFDTSADDQSLNAEDVVEENAAVAAAPANDSGNATGNRQ